LRSRADDGLTDHRRAHRRLRARHGDLANRRYFDNARDLTVSFEEIDVAVGPKEAVVSYTRRDRFIDAQTKQPTKVDIRLTKTLVLVDGAWKLVSGRPQK
jgi:hypothetical protein